MARVVNKHQRAVTRMLRSTGLIHVPEEAPLIELLKDLAKELDDGGGARPRAAYLSALKDLRRVINNTSVRPTGSSDAASVAEAAESTGAPEDVPQPNDLAKFKEQRGIA